MGAIPCGCNSTSTLFLPSHNFYAISKLVVDFIIAQQWILFLKIQFFLSDLSQKLFLFVNNWDYT